MSANDHPEVPDIAVGAEGPVPPENAEPTFTSQEAASVQTALRGALGLAPEQFPLQAFVGMISDEIDQLRADGKNDAAIADMIAMMTGKQVTGELISRYYASRKDRRLPEAGENQAS